MIKIVDWINSWTLDGKLSILIFFPIAYSVFFAAQKLSLHSEVITHKSKLGGAFFGGTIIALITSIPELITEISQAQLGSPQNGLMDDIGSNAFSTFLVGLVAIIFFKKNMFLNKMERWTKITLIFSAFSTTIILIFTLLSIDANIGGYIGIVPMTLFLIYLIYTVLQYFFDKKSEDSNEVLDPKLDQFTLKYSSFMFITWSVLLVASSLFMNLFASSIKHGLNFSDHSVGGLMLAITTSLPEIVVFVALVRVGKTTMALSTLIGSQIFNLGIVFFGDLSFVSGPSFLFPEMQQVWKLALLTLINISLLCFQAYLPKKYIKGKTYLIIPIILVLTYFVGWVIILTT